MEENIKTVTNLQLHNKLKFARGRYNIIDCGVRTGKTYWAVNNLQQFSRDGKLNRILFLVNTNALKDQIVHDYSDQCVDASDDWYAGGFAENKIGVMCYQRLGSYIIKEELDFLNEIDVICWDECDSIFDFATSAFIQARKKDFARENVSNAEVLAIIQQYSSNPTYMPLILLGAWEKIIQQNRILCIGLSATPERAEVYYNSLIYASNEGKLEAGYRTMADVYFTNILEHIKHLRPEDGHGYWCYSPYIEPNKGIVECAKNQGFHAIEIHSPNNIDKPMTPEQLKVYNCIITTRTVPYEYDFVVVNAALKTGITIEDQRFDRLIVNSYDEVDRIQAARQTFPYQRHLKTFAPEIPACYLNQWISVEQCRELAEYLNVPELDTKNRNTNRIMTWNKLRKYLPAIGYNVEAKRKTIGGKQQTAYFITGEWHDANFKDGEFLQLVAAKSSLNAAGVGGGV
jgi:hypothetical protein